MSDVPVSWRRPGWLVRRDAAARTDQLLWDLEEFERVPLDLAARADWMGVVAAGHKPRRFHAAAGRPPARLLNQGVSSEWQQPSGVHRVRASRVNDQDESSRGGQPFRPPGISPCRPIRCYG